MIADFEDGSHIIPMNWIIKENNGGMTCFVPDVDCEKTFCKMSKYMISPKKHWKVCKILKFSGSSGKYSSV